MYKYAFKPVEKFKMFGPGYPSPENFLARFRFVLDLFEQLLDHAGND